MEIRLATMNDSKFLLDCRNDLQTRMASHNSDLIPEKNHIEWLKKTLYGDVKNIYIVSEKNAKVGTVRVDVIVKNSLDIAEISWTVAKDSRGNGFAKKMVRLVTDTIKIPLYAEIKKGNIASIKVAESIGFKMDKTRGDILEFSKNNI
jgi:RimJ/RimL family protein N-acetyltransferase